MSDLTTTPRSLAATWAMLDKPLLVVAAIYAAVAIAAPGQVGPTLSFALRALAGTAPVLVFAVLAIGLLKATGAEAIAAKAFEGRETRMILVAALAGGISPFCSCEVIPFIAAMLTMGAPLSAVMAFWLASPLMDPAMFLITAGELGLSFALAKTAAAIGLGLFGGFGVAMLGRTGLFSDPLKATAAPSCGCGANPLTGRPVWKFWTQAERRRVFWRESARNAFFLGKWLFLAYTLEALMVAYVPASLIATLLGGDGFQPVLLGALVGGPAYLNGYAAVPLLAGLTAQGMSQGAAMACVIAGGVSSIPAALAVWALVKPRIFAAYLGFALVGALVAGSLWGALA